MNYDFDRMLETAKKRRNWKCPAAAFPYGCNNYYWLKPGSEDVVCLGTSARVYIELKEEFVAKGATYHHRVRWPKRNTYRRFLPIIELHREHAIIRPVFTEEDTMIQVINKQTVASMFPDIEPEHIEDIKFYGSYEENTAVDTTLNNLMHYLGLYAFHSGTGKRHVPGFIWHFGGKKVHAIGPVKYNYDTKEVLPINGELTKVVDEPARLELNRRIREACKKLRPIARMGVTFSSDDAQQFLKNNDILTKNKLVEFVKEQSGSKAVLENLESLDVTNRESVIKTLMSISACRHLGHMQWRMNHLINAVSSDQALSIATSFLDPAWASDPDALNSTHLAWLRTKLQHDLGIVSYTPQQ